MGIKQTIVIFMLCMLGVLIFSNYRMQSLANMAQAIKLNSDFEISPAFTASVRQNTEFAWIALGLGLIILFSFWKYISRKFIRPLEQITSLVQTVLESRDLTQRIEFESSDEIGRLATATNGTMADFERVIAEVATLTIQLSVDSKSLSTLTEKGKDQLQKEHVAVSTVSNIM